MKKYVLLFIGIIGLQSLMHAQGTVILDSFYSASLGSTRYMRIYLPDGYDTSGIDYPVIYFLHGGGSNHNSYSNIYFHLDTLIGNGHIEPVIVVKPDASVGPYYGSCYTNSTLYGDYEDYIVYDVVEYIETNYRTIASRDKRCIMGHSMGGDGSLKLAFKHPDLYRAVVGHSGLVDQSVLLQYYIPIILAENGGSPPYTYNPNAGIFTGVAFTLCGAFSPDTTDPPYFVDFILDSMGNVDSTVYDLWRPHDVPVLAAQLPQDTIAIYFDCGMSDEYHCYPMHTALAESLDVLGLDYEWQPYAGSHDNQLNVRFPIALAFLDSVMSTGIDEGYAARPVEQCNIGATIISGPLTLPPGEECRVFDISGRYVEPDKVTRGIYFVEQAGVIVQKIVKVR
ncbi:MAG: prolyl oligopeptidase family serine peptidase [candidate division WOR-3 bacterium]|nr:MAG: prolyl oligopeptidase family serine peptidase [candidate division WOR-3 bacterium]